MIRVGLNVDNPNSGSSGALYIPNAARVASNTQFNTDSGSYITITGMSASVTTANGIIVAHFNSSFITNVTAIPVFVRYSVDTVGEANSVIVSFATFDGNSGEPTPNYLATNYIFTGLSVGSHLIEVKTKVNTGNVTFLSATDNFMHLHLLGL